MKITRLSVGRIDRQTELEIVVEIVVEIGRRLESKLLWKLVTILSYTIARSKVYYLIHH